ncbi:hypothetical protein HYT57_02040 [Candidatus Woesearchaeota archaeon]|nr:hypothetical protein [Candidatus Woesearchaeota archaeon]
MSTFVGSLRLESETWKKLDLIKKVKKTDRNSFIKKAIEEKLEKEDLKQLQEFEDDDC